MVASGPEHVFGLQEAPNRPVGPAAGLRALRELCAAAGSRGALGAVGLGLDAIDRVLPQGGLGRGGVHEWIGMAEAAPPEVTEAQPKGRGRPGEWVPALGMLARIAARALSAPLDEAAGEDGRHVAWIGQSVWPHARVLARAPARDSPTDVLARSLFIRAPDPGERLWAADLALRSSAAAAVITDATGFDLGATRRLQLAAEAGGGLCVLARPPSERSILSAATTRWLVSACPSLGNSRRWTVELLRCKGVQPAPHAPRVWTLEHDHATRALAVVPDILDRHGETPPRTPAIAGGPSSGVQPPGLPIRLTG